MRDIAVEDETAALRLDRWLWAARFFKTRSLAAEAVSGGKVHLNGARTKPAKAVRVGDTLSIQKGPFQSVVTVLALCNQRRPAREAALLYEETEGSRTERARVQAELRATTVHPAQAYGRPSKKGRRDLVKLRRARPGEIP